LESVAVHSPLRGGSRSDRNIDITENSNRLYQNPRIYRQFEVVADGESHDNLVGRNQVDLSDATDVDTSQHDAVTFVQP
jgi:hypothetical protein